MSSTSAEDIRTHAVSPVSILAGGAGAGGAPGAAAPTGGAAAGGDWANTAPEAHMPNASISRVTRKTRDALITASPPRPLPSQCTLVALAGSNANGRVHWMHEDLAVADIARLGGPGEDTRDLVD